MRYCVLLSGKSNEYLTYYHSFKKHILDVYNPDIFICTSNGDHIVNMLNIYKPKSHSIVCNIDNIVSDFSTYLDDIKYEDSRETIINSIAPMFYGISECNKLKIEYEKSNNFKYDIVIRCRFDLNFDKISDSMSIQPYNFHIPEDEIKDALNDNIIYLRKDPYIGDRYYEKWIWDQFAFGNSKSMDIYCGVFENLKWILITFPFWTNANEMCLYYHLFTNKIETKHTTLTYSLRDHCLNF